VVEAALSRTGTSRRLVVVWAAVAALGGLVAFDAWKERSTSGAPDEHAHDERALLPASIFDIGAIEILSKGTLHRFERDAGGQWFYHGIHAEGQVQHEHTVDPVAAERIDKALTGFGRTRKERDFPLNTQADEFGVTRPEIFIMTYLPKSTQPLSRYAVGIVAPDGLSRYVLPVGSTTVVTIANFQIDNLLQLIASFESPQAAAPASR
jgi:hypothetical protein